MEECTEKVHVAAYDGAFLVEPSCGISGSGATQPVMGMGTWKDRRPLLKREGLLQRARMEECRKQFLFGGTHAFTANARVQLPMDLYGVEKVMKLYLAPGETPLLIACTCLEDWGLIMDYRGATVRMKDDDAGNWQYLQRGDKGHYVQDLINGFPDRDDHDMEEGLGVHDQRCDESATSSDDLEPDDLETTAAHAKTCLDPCRMEKPRRSPSPKCLLGANARCPCGRSATRLAKTSSAHLRHGRPVQKT